MCIKVHFCFIVFAIYLYLVERLDEFLIFYLFVLIHEIAHIVVAKIFDVKIDEVLFLPVGITAKYSHNIKPIVELVVALAGPLISIYMASAFRVNTSIQNINLIIAFLNLIPIYPLDGGRVIRSILTLLLGKQKSFYISNFISKVVIIFFVLFSVILSIYFKNYYLLMVSCYICIMVQDTIKKERIRYAIDKIFEM